jgi:hypothetical protein
VWVVKFWVPWMVLAAMPGILVSKRKNCLHIMQKCAACKASKPNNLFLF